MKTVLILTTGCAVLLFSGCASSERMNRMSGNVISSYSVPKSTRLRSKKYQKMGEYAHGRDDNSKKLNTNGELINLWPFFFRSQQYYAFLWPLADFDPYGMAIRPFYNQEGDDHSILFPLSSWNTVDKSGWALSAYWDQRNFAFLPFVWHSFTKNYGTYYYTPLFIHNWKNYNDPRYLFSRTKTSFTEILLAYRNVNIEYDTTGYEAIVSAYNGNKINETQLKNELCYRGQTGPAKGEKIIDWAKKTVDSLPDKKEISGGFFPIFHHFSTKEASDLRMLLFFDIKKQDSPRFRKNDFSFFGSFLGEYLNESYLKDPGWRNVKSKSQFDAWLLFSRFKKEEIFRDTPEYKAWKELDGMRFKSGIDYQKNKEIRSHLTAIDPNLKLPKTVVDKNTFRLFINDTFTKYRDQFPSRVNYSGGFLPFFNYSFTEKETFWCTPALLTCYQKYPHKTCWWSLPFLAYSGKRDGRSVFTIGTPLVWYTKTNVPNLSRQCSVLPRNAKFARDWQKAEQTNAYALCGIYYHGRDVFFVEKEGLPTGLTEQVRREILTHSRAVREMNRQQRNLAKQMKDTKGRMIKTKIEYHQQQIDLERARIRQDELNKKKAELEKKGKQLLANTQKLKFTIPADFCDSDQKAYLAQEALVKQNAERRVYEDYGHGLLTRREIFYNGDTNWHLLHFIAGGEKKGDYEKTHILQLLYRHIQQGNKSETLCFPFILTRKDGEDKYFSFMWRVFDIGTKQGKTSGHILFIPF